MIQIKTRVTDINVSHFALSYPLQRHSPCLLSCRHLVPTNCKLDLLNALQASHTSVLTYQYRVHNLLLWTHFSFWSHGLGYHCGHLPNSQARIAFLLHLSTVSHHQMLPWDTNIFNLKLYWPLEWPFYLSNLTLM